MSVWTCNGPITALLKDNACNIKILFNWSFRRYWMYKTYLLKHFQSFISEEKNISIKICGFLWYGHQMWDYCRPVADQKLIGIPKTSQRACNRRVSTVLLHFRQSDGPVNITGLLPQVSHIIQNKYFWLCLRNYVLTGPLHACSRPVTTCMLPARWYNGPVISTGW